MAEFEVDLKGNLDKLWNRLSSGSYLPPPVRAVEIPKHSGGVRVLGVPTVADRIAQTVVRRYLEPEVEPMFHPDSYGYRPGRSALDAVGYAGSAAGRRTGSSTWTSKPSSTAWTTSWLFGRCPSTSTPTGGGSCGMCSGGLWRRGNDQTAPLSRGIVAVRRARRSHPCSPTSSCTTRSMPGWPGPSRTSDSNATATMSSCTAPASSKPGRSGTPSRSGWRRAAWS